jgi:hypothetical protein
MPLFKNVTRHKQHSALMTQLMNNTQHNDRIIVQFLIVMQNVSVLIANMVNVIMLIVVAPF